MPRYLRTRIRAADRKRRRHRRPMNVRSPQMAFRLPPSQGVGLRGGGAGLLDNAGTPTGGLAGLLNQILGILNNL